VDSLLEAGGADTQTLPGSVDDSVNRLDVGSEHSGRSFLHLALQRVASESGDAVAETWSFIAGVTGS
jgi:hypothetical protein